MDLPVKNIHHERISAQQKRKRDAQEWRDTALTATSALPLNVQHIVFGACQDDRVVTLGIFPRKLKFE